MANTKSAAKRARQNDQRTTANRHTTTAVKTQLKNNRRALKSGEKAATQASVQKLSSTVDKAAKTGRIHINKANRIKSRIAKSLANLA